MIRTGLLVLALMLSPLAQAALELDESPAEPGDWGYRPADAAEPALNPPGFTWRPCLDAASYVLEIAADDAFSEVVYERSRILWSAHCPDGVLPPGTYRWRYAAQGADGTRTGWSRVRSFTISHAATLFPQPSLLELLERLPDEHPRLFFTGEDIERLRGLATGPLSERWGALVASARKLLESPPDCSEPPLYPEGTEYKGAEWKKIWWGNRGRVQAVADGAATLAFVYRVSGEREYGRAAGDLLVAMTKWDPKGATSYRYNDEAAMPAMYLTSRAYTWAYPMLTPENRAAVSEMMRIRGGQAFDHLMSHHHLWRPYSSHSNRAWHFLGEIAIAFQGAFPEADTWLDYAMTVMYTAYPVWGDADGGWHEGTGYWSSYTSRFMQWVAVARAAFDIDVFERPFYQRTGYYGLYTLPPGTDARGYGDLPATSKRIGPLMAMLAAGARNPHWQWYADAVGAGLPGGYLGFLYAARAADLEPEPPTDLPGSTCFRGIGLTAMNTNLLDGADNVQVLFKSSPFGTQSHGYNACNSFLLSMRGQPVLVRSGKRDVYGSPHHKLWMWNTKSDNAILVNGEGQYPRDRRSIGRITLFDTTPDLDMVVGEAGEAYANLTRWTRRLVFFKPHAVVIHDVLEAPEPSTFQWLLHAPSAFDISEGRVGWSGDNGSIDVRFLEPGGLRITQTDQYDPPPAEWSGIELHEWHLTAETTEPVAQREFLVLIVLDGAEVMLAPAGDAYLFGTPSHETELHPSRDALTIRLEDRAYRLE